MYMYISRLFSEILVQLWLPGGGLVHVHASVDPSAVIGAAAVIQGGARIGRNCQVGSSSVVGSDVSIGENTILGFQVGIGLCNFACSSSQAHDVLLPAIRPKLIRLDLERISVLGE